MREPSTVLALLATIAPTLYSVAASADSPDPPVQGENQPTPPKEYDRYNWNLGLGEDFRTTMSMHALYDLRSKQRAGTSLSYLAPVNDGSYSQKGDYNVFVGRRLAKWLDVEFMAHLDTDLQIFSVTPVVDPAFSGTTQESFEDHHTEFGESAYSVTFLPQWDLRRWLGVYGRIGVGYAESEVSSNLRSYGRILIDRRCRTDQYGIPECFDIYQQTEREWSDYHKKSNGFFPILGVGIDIFKTVRLEYAFRAHVPIAGTTTNIRTWMLSVQFFNGRWADL
jgi:opacity protein-like surface antigen